MNVVSIWRIRSGDAWVSRSDRNPWGSISWGAVIAGVPFEWDVGVSSKASRGDRFYFAVDTPTGVNVLRDSYTTLPDATPRRVGHCPTQPVHHIKTRSNSQHLLNCTASRELTRRVPLTIVIATSELKPAGFGYAEVGGSLFCSETRSRNLCF